MRSYKVITEGEQLLTRTEVKLYLKVDSDADDNYIDDLLVAAQRSCEEYTNRFFTETTVLQYGDTWDDAKELLKSHLTTMTSIQYYDSDNTLQTLATSVYTYDTALMPTRIALKPDQSFPALADKINAVEIKYNSGEATVGDVNFAIKQAVLLTIGHWYQNRSAVVVGSQVNEVPMSARYLLNQYKIQVIR